MIRKTFEHIFRELMVMNGIDPKLNDKGALDLKQLKEESREVSGLVDLSQLLRDDEKKKQEKAKRKKIVQGGCS
jgi:hypothetical protein